MVDACHQVIGMSVAKRDEHIKPVLDKGRQNFRLTRVTPGT